MSAGQGCHLLGVHVRSFRFVAEVGQEFGADQIADLVGRHRRTERREPGAGCRERDAGSGVPRAAVSHSAAV
ncbi:hypothetical protein [Streptomyces sp. NPDC048442]|uniref:hypothetical protein n=1 Tax=Streptomyces sp. NPDC048442 TaxID=3154823 RepID=UPI003443B6E9